jgi:hypothetical protein
MVCREMLISRKYIFGDVCGRCIFGGWSAGKCDFGGIYFRYFPGFRFSGSHFTVSHFFNVSHRFSFKILGENENWGNLIRRHVTRRNVFSGEMVHGEMLLGEMLLREVYFLGNVTRENVISRRRVFGG